MLRGMSRSASARLRAVAPRLPLFVGCVAVAVVGLLACASLRDDLLRAESAFDAARYDDALVWLEDLERDTAEMDIDQRSRFYYLRGMTAYRLGKRPDALHYLALAREVAGPRHQGLRTEWGRQMERVLEELTPQGAGEARPPEPSATVAR
jgi:hypothetical protein